MTGPEVEQPRVLTLLVSHDGARWLPTVLAGLAAQEVAPDHVVGVDTGSRDESPVLLAAALGPAALVTAGPDTTYAAAVREGLAQAPPSEWVWLLHDDSTPDAGALAALLAAAAADPGADLLGPKIREWPSLRRLLEVGVTITGTGRRETGLEPGEWDQGQHDRVRDVLAVNTAGLLVRRSVLVDLGLDDALPVTGADLDLGWRAARAGRRTVVVPAAVVFHAEAAQRGLRVTPLTGDRPRRARREAALHTVLANTTGPLRAVQWVRLLVGSLLRAVAYLLMRAPGEARDELGALWAVHGHPGRLRTARRLRAGLPPSDRGVRRLLAPTWLPYRQGLDAVGGLLAALSMEASDVADRRRAARGGPAAPPRASEEDDYAESGWLVRYLTDPVALAVTVAVIGLLWATRQGLEGGGLSGPGLSPAPGGVADWWRLWIDAHHALGQGSDVAAPAYLLPLALLATVLAPLPGGAAGAAVGLVLLAAGPVALWGAWRLLRTLGRVAGVEPARPLLAAGAVAYALVPLTSGAWGQGRLAAVVGAAVLPWLARAALGLLDPAPDRRRRAGWRAAVLLALVTAFAPVAWAVALVLTVVGLLVVRPRGRAGWVPPLVPVLATPVLLLPWTLPTLLGGRPATLLLEAGRLPAAAVDGPSAALGRLAEAGAPGWVGLLVAGLAVGALLVTRVRAVVLACWAVAAAAALVLAGLAGVTVALPAGAARPGLSLLVVLLAGCAVAAATLGLAALPRRVAVVAAAVAPVAGLVWAVTGGGDALTVDADDPVPAYMSQNAATGPDQGVLVVTGSVETGLSYVVRRGARVDLGEDEILAATPTDPALTTAVHGLATRVDGAADAVAGLGVAYVLLPAPADGRIAATLDATDGLEPASAVDPDTRAWRLVPDAALAGDGLTGEPSALRWLLLLAQGAAVVVALVLCGPARASSHEAPGAAGPARAVRPGGPALLAGLTGVVVLATGGALLAVPGDPVPAAAVRPPETAPLTRQQLLCPAGASSALTSPAASGSVRVGLRGAASPQTLTRRRALAGPSGAAFAVDGRGDLAPGLVATVADVGAGSATACRPPVPDYWFTGAGATADHTSTLHLVNPDGSPAVAEIELLGDRGPVDAGTVRSVTVPGGSAVTVDLAARVPSRSSLAVHVSVVRGRLGAQVADRLVGLQSTSTQWLPAQSAAAATSVLTGLAGGTGQRTLLLANPGDDQTDVTVQVVDDESTFSPTGVDPIEVPGGSLVSVRLPAAVAQAVADGAALQISADRPVTATLRSVTGDHLSLAVASPAVTRAALLLPAFDGGRATLTLAAPDAAGAATVTAYDAGGRRLGGQRAGVRRLTAQTLALPARTRLLTVTAQGAALVGAVRVVAGARVVTLPLTGLVTTSQVPDVAPAGPGSPAEPQSSGR